MKTSISKVDIPEGTSSLPLKLLGDRLLIRPEVVTKDEMYKGTNIQVAKSEAIGYSKGEIVAAGPGNSHNKITVACGNTVLYNPNSASDIHFDGETYDMIRDSDIIMVL